MTSFSSQKQLRVTLIMTRENTVFAGTNSNTLILTGLRMSAQVRVAARLATEMELRIYGMRDSDMNALTVAWANPPVVLDHVVILEANDGTGWSEVFRGTIIEAQPEYRGAPAVFFNIQAVTGYFKKIEPAAPTSYPFEVDIGVAAADIIERMGFTYVDGGATGVLTNPYFKGTLYDQLSQACAAADADFYIQGNSILVTPSSTPRSEQPKVVLTPQTGLIGYPVYERAGLIVNAVFDAAFSCGSALKIESRVPSATGLWFPYMLQHTLESEMPDGQWMTTLKCLRVVV